MADPTPGPLVPAKWAVLWAGAGLAVGAYAQLGAPGDLVAPAALLASVLTYLGTGELPQPDLLRRIGKLVPAGLVPGCALLATGLHQQAVAQSMPLLHLLATTVALVAGVAEQPTVGGGK